MYRKIKRSIQDKTDHMVPDKWQEIQKEAEEFMKSKANNNCDKRSRNSRKPILLLTSACLVILLAIFIGDTYISWDIASDKAGKQNNISLENKKPNIINFIGNSNTSAVYHNVDISKIIRKTSQGKVPFGFFFSDKIMDLVKEDVRNKNKEVYWEEEEYTKDDIEKDFQIAIKPFALPDGNYTMKQYVLKGKSNQDIIGYKIVYYYFDKETLDFQSSYSLFFFSEQHFRWNEIQQMQNVRIADGKINIGEFVQPTNINAKIPHIRRLIYLEDGVSIAIEAETYMVLEGNNIDLAKSLERYKKVDKQLVNMMKSLIE